MTLFFISKIVLVTFSLQSFEKSLYILDTSLSLYTWYFSMILLVTLKQQNS